VDRGLLGEPGLELGGIHGRAARGVEVADALAEAERAWNACCTVTCWSIANPISKASGSD
jgi:hypothetical protein